jgi:hypothetical protein
MGNNKNILYKIVASTCVAILSVGFQLYWYYTILPKVQSIDVIAFPFLVGWGLSTIHLTAMKWIDSL